ncbi:hypothetical protein JGU66_25330 [Myxococcaceae bacterium JPH2]|nr:hypothetical protein [Myxococcaceae bacterium JPH2]
MNTRWSAVPRWLPALALGSVTLLASSAARADDNAMCIRDASGVPFSPGPPTVDGVVPTDKGWTGAFRYEASNGTDKPHAVLQAVRNAGSAFLSVEVNNDPHFDAEDAVVLAFDLGAGPKRYRRLIIYPLVEDGNGVEANQRPAQLDYFESDTATGGVVDWGTVMHKVNAELDPSAPGAFWLDAKVSTAVAGVNDNSWFVEMRLPTANLNLAGATNPRVYVNVMRVNNLDASVLSERWPTGTPPPLGFLDTSTPNTSTWGALSLGGGGTCTGLSIKSSDIRTNNSSPTLIMNPGVAGQNVFQAVVTNSGSTDASGVRATFRIANFGLQTDQSWKPVPVANNPSPPSGVIAKNGGTQTLQIPSWILNAQEQADYTGHAHQCILVDLTSGGTPVTFINSSAYRNMDFGTASVFERTAQLSTRGLPTDPGKKVTRLRLDTVKGMKVLNTDGEKGDAAKRVARMTWLFHGYRETGQTVTIRGTSYRLLDSMGSFGYVVDHTTPPIVPGKPPEEEAVLNRKWQLQVKSTRPELPVRALPRLDLMGVADRLVLFPRRPPVQTDIGNIGPHAAVTPPVQGPIATLPVERPGTILTRAPIPTRPLPDLPTRPVPTLPTGVEDKETPATYYIDIPEGESVDVLTHAEFPEAQDGGKPVPDCGCRRTPTTGASGVTGLLFLAFVARRRGRRDDA